MAKKIKCKLLLHGIRKQTTSSEFSSITEAREWLRYWYRPYTLIKETDARYKHL